MHWGAYEILSMLSGALLVLGAGFASALSTAGRLGCALAGVAIGGYGVYVAQQTTGTYVFSTWIFVIPAGAFVVLVMGWWEANSRRTRRASVVPAADRGPVRRCISCGQRYAHDSPGPCPACHGSLVLEHATPPGT